MKGINGCGPSSLSKLMKDMIKKVGEKETSLKKELSTWMVKELSMTKKAVDVFCKAFICEPCNEVTDASQSYKYIVKPRTMPIYLEAFLHPKVKSIKLDKSLDLSTCYGCGSDFHHTMLSCEKKIKAVFAKSQCA